MIRINTNGPCYGCPYLEIVSDGVYLNNKQTMRYYNCEHNEICKRILRLVKNAKEEGREIEFDPD